MKKGDVFYSSQSLPQPFSKSQGRRFWATRAPPSQASSISARYESPFSNTACEDLVLGLRTINRGSHIQSQPPNPSAPASTSLNHPSGKCGRQTVSSPLDSSFPLEPSQTELTYLPLSKNSKKSGSCIASAQGATSAALAWTR